MTTAWSPHELELVDAAAELDVAVERADGTWTGWTPIWVVRAGDDVHVRTWYPRTTGWYGRAVRSGRARVRVPGLETDVVVEPVEGADVDVAVSTAYRAKYAAGAASMVAPDATSTTLRLRPEDPRERREPRASWLRVRRRTGWSG